MSNSYRIRTTPGVDKSIKVLIDQEFEYIEILSLKILQEQIYTRQCSDYGVVIGRISINNGFGLPNAKVSIFIPLTDEDSVNPIISEIYPYKTTTDQNEDGYRYNLLPYTKSHSNHTPTGTFFDREDVLIDPTLIEVYDKYYKYTTTTNDSGDFMLFGVPTGQQTIFVDLDLSDIGEFSLTPNDLIRMGVATEDMVDKNQFKSSDNLDSLPQIISINRNINVEPLWGQPEICNLGITRTDFDISKEANIDIRPTAVFMGSLISSIDETAMKANCKPNKKLGELCSMNTGPGEIKAIRQTIDFDLKGRPALEVFDLQNGGQVIDEDGVWVLDLPMNMDYVITNEFGEQVISADPSQGIPTKSKYRFKVKWNQSPSLKEPIKRGYYLVPNIREYGHNINDDNVNLNDLQRSYAFTVDWDDYGDDTTTFGAQMVQDAIDCKDKFYEFQYNKVYTISNLITQYRQGINKRKFVGIKNILDEQCESENNKFPSNDSQKRTDVIYLLFTILNILMFPVIVYLITLLHILSFLVIVILQPFFVALAGYFFYQAFLAGIKAVGSFIPPGAPGLAPIFILEALSFLAVGGVCIVVTVKIQKIKKYFQNFKLPNLTYPDCQFCDCDAPGAQDTATAVNAEGGGGGGTNTVAQNDKGTALLTPYNNPGLYDPKDNDGGTYQSVLMSLLSGFQIPPTGDIGNGVSTTCLCNKFEYEKKDCHQVTPYVVVTEDEEEDQTVVKAWRAFGTDLPLPERINLFNLKSNYFSTTNPNTSFNIGVSPSNGGQGVNQIKVRFDKNLNSPSTTLSSLPLGTSSHLDNVMVIVVQSSVGSSFIQGQLVTFQDASMSNDINLTGATANDYGTNSITGTPILQSGVTTPVTVTWAEPTGVGVGSNNSTTYLLTGNTSDAAYHKFPMDVEYFQVVTGMSYSNFISQKSNTLENSLVTRVFENTNYVNRIKRYKGECNCTDDSTFTPTNIFEKNSEQYVIILVRGVDPNSSRTTCEYDLSKIFGYNSFGNIVVEGNYKLNVPIQGGPKNTQHAGNNNTLSPYSGQKLYYPSYQFNPSNMSGFTTHLTDYYSMVDNSHYLTSAVPNLNLGVTCGPWSSSNEYTRRWTTSYQDNNCDGRDPSTYSLYPNRECYYPYENLEGGSILRMYNVEIDNPRGCCKCNENHGACGITDYYCPRYTAGYTINPSLSILTPPNIVMRSDRLPTSTFDYDPLGNNQCRPLHANPGFEVYLIDDEAQSLVQPYSNGVSDAGTFEDGPSNPLTQSLTCGGLAPFQCYQPTSSGEVVVLDVSDPCWTNKINGELIMQKGCYVLVTVPLLSIVRDIRLLTEWRGRMAVNFAACRNVFSHIFTNNWVNGTLFAFPFKNDTTYDNQNNPIANFCDEVIYLDKTVNNFYYRSAAYTASNTFVGQASSVSKGNYRNLMYPTTVLDLGPRDLFIQEVTTTDAFDGYIVNNLKSTTFNDVSELLNLFLINRLTSNSFIQTILTASVQRFFRQRDNDMIDGDYAQMNSINSEFGVVPFDFNYDSSKIKYVNADDDNVFGIFFDSDLQDRDYISPKRTIYLNTGNTSSTDCAFSNIPVKSQEVPSYLWEIKPNTDGGVYDTIFGSQKNEWNTSLLSNNAFFSHEYQSLDRLLSTSRYFRTTNQNQTNYYKGYIYSVDSVGVLSDDLNTWSQNTTDSRSVTVGVPFHFYFGLKQGSSAFDKFGRIWLDFENID